MNNSLDEQLKSIFNKNRNTELPEKTKITIKHTLINLKKEKSKCKKQIIFRMTACCAICLLGCGLVFAKEIKNFVQDIFNYDVQGTQGVQIAADKGYIQNIDMEYIESNNTKFKIDYVTMDDTTLALNFNFLLDQNADKFRGLSFYNMKIYDDLGNIIYTEEENFPNEGISLGIGISKPIFVSGNNLVESFLIESDRFPKTKTLRITFDKITLYNENMGNPIIKEINGDFDITIQLDEKFYNRETQIYNIEAVTNAEKIELSNVFLTNTSLNFIIDNTALNELSMELKDENGNILYNIENIYLKEINDESHRKIAKIDITKYEKLGKSLQLTIKAKDNSESSRDIYLYNYTSENDRIYDIEKIEKNLNYENDSSYIIAKYILKSEN